MENDCEKEVDSMEKEAKYTIIQMEDDIDGDQSFLDDTKKEVSRLYQDFRDWLSENVDSEEISARLKKLKEDTADVLEKGKTKTEAFVKREDVQNAKGKVVSAGEKVMDGVSDGLHTIMENEHVSKAMDSISDTITSVKNDERVKRNVNKLKKGTLKAATHAFNGLKKVLDTDDSDE